MEHKHSHAHYPEASLLMANTRGIFALKISFIGLMITAVLQSVIVYFSHSTALLADTLHNLADAFTAVPLWVAFIVSRRKPSREFTYGYNRWEDIAGLFILLLIFGTAIVVGIESYKKLISGDEMSHIPWVMGGAIVGFLGNEWVARLRIRIGKEINSVALIADGEHARADGYTSLGVLVGAIGTKLGFPRTDAVMGLLFSLLILKIGWDSSKGIFFRLADRIDFSLVDSIRDVARNVPRVLNVMDIKARYAGHSLRVEVTIEVDGHLTVEEGHEIAIDVQYALQQQFPLMISPTIHVDPQGHPGEAHHFVEHHRSHHHV